MKDFPFTEKILNGKFHFLCSATLSGRIEAKLTCLIETLLLETKSA